MSVERDFPTVPVVPKANEGSPKVMLACPWGKNVNPLTAYSTMMLVQRHKLATLLHFGDAFIAHARNVCADSFLRTECDYLLMIDDDMVVPFGHAVWFKEYSALQGLSTETYAADLVPALLSTGKSLVGALYVQRHAKGKPLYSKVLPSETPGDPVKPVRWVATGAMMIHRSVFLDIERTFPALARPEGKKGGQWFSSSEHELTQGIDELLVGLKSAAKTPKEIEYALRDLRERTKANSTVGMGEDVQFCIRAAQAGHPAHVATNIVCGHVGTTVYGPHNTSG